MWGCESLRPGNTRRPARVDEAGIGGTQAQDLCAAVTLSPLTAKRLRFVPAALQCGHLGIVHDQVCRLRLLSRATVPRPEDYA